MKGEIELQEVDDYGEIVVIGALEPQTGVLMEFCLPLHAMFPVWSEKMRANGWPLCRMTVQDMVDSIYNDKKVMQ